MNIVGLYLKQSVGIQVACYLKQKEDSEIQGIKITERVKQKRKEKLVFQIKFFKF